MTGPTRTTTLAEINTPYALPVGDPARVATEGLRFRSQTAAASTFYVFAPADRPPVIPAAPATPPGTKMAGAGGAWDDAWPAALPSDGSMSVWVYTTDTPGVVIESVG